jgi:hypothetical protein
MKLRRPKLPPPLPQPSPLEILEHGKALIRTARDILEACMEDNARAIAQVRRFTPNNNAVIAVQEEFEQLRTQVSQLHRSVAAVTNAVDFVDRQELDNRLLGIHIRLDAITEAIRSSEGKE